MNETEKSLQSPTPEKGNTNNKLAMIAIAVSLLVAVLALALWFDVRNMRAQTHAIETQAQTSVAAEHEQRAALSAEARVRDQKLAARQESLEQGMQGLREQLGREHHDWVVAESDYMLRFAQRRLLLEHDVRGALIALHSVDALLAEGANPLYLPVREQLRGEIQSLEALPRVDVDGIALELSGLSKQVDTLPLATARRDLASAPAEQQQPAAAEDPAESGFLNTLWRGIKDMFRGMVTVRRVDQKIQPMLPPEQSYFLGQNLRLRLETARLALLRGDTAVYQENLKTAAAWISEYYDSSDAAVKYNRDTLTRLAQINIAPALPEIGTSLRTLERIYEKQTGRKPAAALRSRQP